jgi:hypothetical protein
MFFSIHLKSYYVTREINLAGEGDRVGEKGSYAMIQ